MFVNAVAPPIFLLILKEKNYLLFLALHVGPPLLNTKTSKRPNEFGTYGAGKWNIGILKMPQFSRSFIYNKIPKNSGGTQITSPDDACAPLP
jgi:hypothetical protein